MSKQLLNTPSKHPFSLSGLADKTWNFLSESAFRTAWAPLTGLAQMATMSLMQRVNKGSFRVLTYTGVHTFPHAGPKSPAERTAELRVVNDVFWIRLCTMGDLGFAEAYMYGDVECDDLVSLFHIFLDNRDNLSNMNSRASYLFTLPQKITSYRFLNTISNSRSNVSAHYDISNDMFAGFLSEDMTYSCAIFEDLDGDLKSGADHRLFSGAEGLQRLSSEEQMPTEIINDRLLMSENDPLYRAQMRKLTHIIKKAKIMPGHRVLEIGSGWCSMAILIAQTILDTTVDTLTLSVEQQTLARQRIQEVGLQDRISVHLMDYRNMPAEWEAAFDRFISVEMIEAVGKEFLVTYWEQVDWALKKKGAVGVVQVITIPEARFERYMREVDFIRKWSMLVSFLITLYEYSYRVLCAVFPGGFLPTLVLLFETLQTGSKGRLTVDSVSNIGPHYARTLREWRKRFLLAFESKIVPALQRQYPDVMSGPNGRSQIEVFKRKWIYYYCYCEVGFTTRTLGDHIISFTREGCQEYGCDTYE